jgi:diacylglycerol kinase family enzyme
MSTAGTAFSMVRLSGPRPHIGRRGAHLRHDLPALVLRADKPLPVQVDGDYLGLRDSVEVTSVPAALNVLV